MPKCASGCINFPALFGASSSNPLCGVAVSGGAGVTSVPSGVGWDGGEGAGGSRGAVTPG